MHPELLELGPFTLHSYGVLLAAAFLGAITLATHLAEKEGISKHQGWQLGLVVIFSAYVGGKLMMVVSDPGGYLQQPSRFLGPEFWRAGGVYYGGLIGAILGVLLFLFWRPELQTGKVADAAAPAIALGQTIGRVGCFAAGCDYGKAAEVPWAVTFTSENAHRLAGVPLHIPLHPVQLYESFATLLLFVVLLRMYRRRRFVGQVFCSYLVLYSLLRFFLEFYRGDLDRGLVFNGLLSSAQFASLLTFSAALLCHAWLKTRGVRSSPPREETRSSP